MTKNELLKIGFAIDQLAKAEAQRTQAFIISEQLKAGMISVNDAENAFRSIYNASQLIGL